MQSALWTRREASRNTPPTVKSDAVSCQSAEEYAGPWARLIHAMLGAARRGIGIFVSANQNAAYSDMQACCPTKGCVLDPRLPRATTTVLIPA